MVKTKSPTFPCCQDTIYVRLLFDNRIADILTCCIQQPGQRLLESIQEATHKLSLPAS